MGTCIASASAEQAIQAVPQKAGEGSQVGGGQSSRSQYWKPFGLCMRYCS